MTVGGVDNRPLNNELLAVSTCPLRLGLLRGGEVEESLDSVVGIGTDDTNEIIKAKTSTTRPARERIFE